jgi:hypothetical protein
VYLAPAHRHQAEIYERRGQRDLAAQHYRKFVELWKDADAELQPEVERAREKLTRLQ